MKLVMLIIFFSNKLSSVQPGEGLIELNESIIKPHGEQINENQNNENNKENDHILQRKDNTLRFNLNLIKKENQGIKANENTLNLNTNQSLNLISDKNQNNQQKNYLIESVPLNPTFADDKIGTCLELKDIWKFFRDYGIIGEDLTIAQFDRIFYRGKKNAEEMFLIPEELPRRNIYKFLELMVRKSEEKFKSVHEKYVKFTEKEEKIYNKSIGKKNLKGINDTRDNEPTGSKKSNNNFKKSAKKILNEKINENNNNDDLSLYYDEDEGNSELITFDYHNHHNPVLLRQFYEALDRAAYQKYYNSNMRLYKKIELLTSRFSSKPGGGGGKSDKSLLDKSKKKLSRLQSKSIQNSLNTTQNDINSSNVQMPVLGPDGNIILSLEQKLKNDEHLKINVFITKFAVLIKPLFAKLYFYQTELNNFHKESAKINEQTLIHRFVFNNVVKKSEIISKFFGKREQYCEFITYYFREKRINFKTKLDQFKYYESLLDLDMVFFEFCEFVYLICSKNITEKKLSLEDDQNFLDIINHLTDLINGTKEFKNKIMLKKAKYNYEYPILQSHLAKKIQEDEKIRINQVKLLDRIEKVRYNQERQSLKENDENVNPKEDNDMNALMTPEDEENSDDY
jgi:hypothetical protein